MKILFRILIVVTVVYSAADVRAQLRNDVKAVIDTALHQAKKTSLNAHFVSWDSLRAQMYQHGATARTVHDLKPGFEMLLNALNDPHARILNERDNSSLASFSVRQNPELHAQQAQHVVQGEKVKTEFEFRELENGVGYLRIASISPEADLQKEAGAIRVAIDSLAKRESQRWIIDLRYHTDGGFHPVMAGIAPLLGEGQVAGIVDNRNRITKLYEIHNGNFYDDQKKVGRFACLTHDEEPKIAVLISRHTAGPGQVVAVALKGRKNTRFFGEPTAGSVTITKRIPIGKDLVMSLSESVYQDRIGNAYHLNIEPDHEVAYVPPAQNSASDHGIGEALRWLNEEIISSVRE